MKAKQWLAGQAAGEAGQQVHLYEHQQLSAERLVNVLFERLSTYHERA